MPYLREAVRVDELELVAWAASCGELATESSEIIGQRAHVTQQEEQPIPAQDAEQK